MGACQGLDLVGSKRGAAGRSAAGDGSPNGATLCLVIGNGDWCAGPDALVPGCVRRPG